MKLVLYSLVVVLLLLGVVAATSDCEGAASKPTLEYADCILLKPADTVVGDEIIINCTNHEKVNNQWVITPMAKTRLAITGYDEFDIALHGEAAFTRSDGTYEFTPRIAGRYLVQASSCNLNAWFDVDENPILEIGNGPTGAVVAEPAEEPVEPEPPEVIVEPPKVRKGLLEYIVDGASAEAAKEGVSDLVRMLVVLMVG